MKKKIIKRINTKLLLEKTCPSKKKFIKKFKILLMKLFWIKKSGLTNNCVMGIIMLIPITSKKILIIDKKKKNKKFFFFSFSKILNIFIAWFMIIKENYKFFEHDDGYIL